MITSQRRRRGRDGRGRPPADQPDDARGVPRAPPARSSSDWPTTTTSAWSCSARRTRSGSSPTSTSPRSSTFPTEARPPTATERQRVPRDVRAAAHDAEGDDRRDRGARRRRRQRAGAVSCDMRFAGPTADRSTSRRSPSASSPAAAARMRLPRLIGRSRALEVILGCDDIDAATAERWGWVNRVLPTDELATFVDRLAAPHRRAFPPHAVAAAKASVLRAEAGVVEQLLAEGARLPRHARRALGPRGDGALPRRSAGRRPPVERELGTSPVAWRSVRIGGHEHRGPRRRPSGVSSLCRSSPCTDHRRRGDSTRRSSPSDAFADRSSEEYELSTSRQVDGRAAAGIDAGTSHGMSPVSTRYLASDDADAVGPRGARARRHGRRRSRRCRPGRADVIATDPTGAVSAGVAGGRAHRRRR